MTLAREGELGSGRFGEASLSRACIVVGALLGAAAVGAGAFGAHGLRQSLEANGQAGNWETAARYCMYHALALMGLGLLAGSGPRARGMIAAAAACFVAGTLVFSGCLATLALTNAKVLGAVVPIGGVLLIAGWLLAAWAGARAAPFRG